MLARRPVPDVPPADLRVARARAGDVAAFESLYRDHVGRVRALCLRMSADPGLADDLTQTAFVRAWERLGTYRGDAAFSTWLHRLTVHVVLDERRSRQRRDARHLAARGDEISPSREGKVDLERAVFALPDGAREVFVLHDVEGWTHGDIAVALGISEGTTKSQLHRARRLLREALS
jgi:RNA polymerase sigma-70 factor (ECF subfamily)